LGKSRGGWGAKIHAAVSGLMLPVTAHTSAGQEADVSHAKALLGAVPAGAEVKAVMADKGYDSKAVVALVEAMGAAAVIPTLSTRKEQRDRQRPVQGAQLGRTLLAQGQRLPPRGDALREDRPQLPRLRPRRLQHDPAAMTSTVRPLPIVHTT
jgi:hypothetical protein